MTGAWHNGRYLRCGCTAVHVQVDDMLHVMCDVPVLASSRDPKQASLVAWGRIWTDVEALWEVAVVVVHGRPWATSTVDSIRLLIMACCRIQS